MVNIMFNGILIILLFTLVRKVETNFVNFKKQLSFTVCLDNLG